MKYDVARVVSNVTRDIGSDAPVARTGGFQKIAENHIHVLAVQVFSQVFLPLAHLI